MTLNLKRKKILAITMCAIIVGYLLTVGLSSYLNSRPIDYEAEELYQKLKEDTGK